MTPCVSWKFVIYNNNIYNNKHTWPSLRASALDPPLPWPQLGEYKGAHQVCTCKQMTVTHLSGIQIERRRCSTKKNAVFLCEHLHWTPHCRGHSWASIQWCTKYVCACKRPLRTCRGHVLVHRPRSTKNVVSCCAFTHPLS